MINNPATCEFCGGEMRVLNTRKVENLIHRRRECVKCSRRTTTGEYTFKLPNLVGKDIQVETLKGRRAGKEDLIVVHTQEGIRKMLSYEKYHKLRELGVLWELYPDAPETFSEGTPT